MYCSNDLLISTTDAIGRSFYDFVAKKDEEIVRSWITCVKGWGVNEKGQPSDGGFGFGKFKLLTEGRDSVYVDPPPFVISRKTAHADWIFVWRLQASYPGTVSGQKAEWVDES